MQDLDLYSERAPIFDRLRRCKGTRKDGQPCRSRAVHSEIGYCAVHSYCAVARTAKKT
jgi:hypothetical protein